MGYCQCSAFVQVNALPLPPFLPFYSLLASLKIVALVSVPRDPVTPFSGLDFIASQAQIFLGLGEINTAPVLPRQCWRRSSSLHPAACGPQGGLSPSLQEAGGTEKMLGEGLEVSPSATQPQATVWIALEDFLDSKSSGFFCPSARCSISSAQYP